MKEMILTCTTETQFVSPIGQIYLQKDGCTLCIHPIVHCTMGWMHNGHESNWNWLGNGCTMGMIVSGTNLGWLLYVSPNKILEAQPDLKPIIHFRYVDDIFVVAKNIDQFLKLRPSFINTSVLNFTYELEKSKKLNFLDVTVTRGSNGLLTSVYIKPTYDNTGLRQKCS